MSSKKFLFSCTAVVVAVLSLSLYCHADQTGKDFLSWSSLPDLPCARGQSEQIGVAGPFAGVHNDVLLIAGGANFPDALPWYGGKKVWHDTVFVMLRDGQEYRWLDKQFKLPRPLAYGVSISTDAGVVCIGGADAQQCYADSFLMKWDPEKHKVTFESLPSLPRPLAFMTGAKDKDLIFVAGGQEAMKDAAATKNFFMLDMSEIGTDGFQWQQLESWPGPARVVPLSACQSDGEKDCFYLFSGRDVGPDSKVTILADCYQYNIPRKTWQRKSDITPTPSKKPVPVTAGTSWASGANHIIVVGGDDGEIFGQLEKLNNKIAQARQSEDVGLTKELTDKINKVLDEHPGFSKAVYAYHTITDTWVQTGDFPVGSHVTTTAVLWSRPGSDEIIIPSGEVHPGVRSPAIWKGQITIEAGFGVINYTVLAVYLAALVLMGVYFSGKMHDTNDFFKAGQRIPWWAAGLSIFGTQLSALTFMAIPAKTFATDWRYLIANFAIVAVAPFIVFYFLPFYRRLNLTTAYEYLEMRFNLTIRLVGSLMFMVLQFGRISIVLYLPSIALSVVTGIDINICILAMGVLCIFYTVLGGMEAVIWTDVIQVIVLIGGAIWALAVIPMHIEGGWNGMIDIADSANKLRFWDLHWDFTDATFFVMFFGAFGGNIISYGTDQTVIQRYLTTATEKQAARSIWTNAIICIPASLIFFCIGTALYAYYKVHPLHLNPAMPQMDAIFPHYIVTQLPSGVAGLLIAAVFAAAMSSLDSSMNSVAAVITTDFYKRLKNNPSEKTALSVARWSTFFIGVIGTVFALMMAQWDIKSLWDQASAIIGLFGGGLGGLFLLGIFTRRTGATAALLALIVSGLVQYYLKVNTSIHVWLYAFSGIVSCFVTGVILSLIIPNRKKDIKSLTIHNLRQGQ